MPRPPKHSYSLANDSRLTLARWRIAGVGTFRVERGTPGLLKEVDAQWLSLRHDDDDLSKGWEFHTLGQKPEMVERFVVLDEDQRPVAAWLGHDRLLFMGNTYRLDFFKVRPDARGRGLGQFAFGLVGLRAMERGASRIVFQPLKKSEAFYRDKIGAIRCDDWKGGEQLPNFQVVAEALKRLEGILDGYRIEG